VLHRYLWRHALCDDGRWAYAAEGSDAAASELESAAEMLISFRQLAQTEAFWEVADEVHDEDPTSG
jgi:hypothetical protein